MAAADEAYDRLHGLDGCAQAPARALREAAQFFERDISRSWGGDATWFTTGKRVADLVAICLRDRAADLDADRVAGVRRELSEEPCPAPAQAHPLGPDGFTPLVSDADYRAAFYRVMERCEELKTSVAEHQWNALEMARKADQAERRAEDTEAAFERLRSAADKVGHQAACPVDPCDCWMRDLAPLLDDDGGDER